MQEFVLLCVCVSFNLGRHRKQSLLKFISILGFRDLIQFAIYLIRLYHDHYMISHS